MTGNQVKNAWFLYPLNLRSNIKHSIQYFTTISNKVRSSPKILYCVSYFNSPLNAWSFDETLRFMFNILRKVETDQKWDGLTILTAYTIGPWRGKYSALLGLLAMGMMHFGPRLELLGFCPPLGQFNGVQWRYSLVAVDVAYPHYLAFLLSWQLPFPPIT